MTWNLKEKKENVNWNWGSSSDREVLSQKLSILEQ